MSDGEKNEIDPAFIAAVYTDFYYNSQYLNDLVQSQMGTQQLEDRVLNRARTIQDFVNSPILPIEVQECAALQHGIRAKKHIWTEEETLYLEELFAKRKATYTRATAEFNERFHTNLRVNYIHYRWTRVQNPAISKQKWAGHEDRVLRRMVERHASISEMCTRFPARTRLQIRNRCKALQLDVEYSQLASYLAPSTI